MASINITSVLTVAPNNGELVFSGTGDCEIQATYTNYQFKNHAPSVVSLNAGFAAPTCIRKKICTYPVAVYYADNDAFANSLVSSGEFDDSEDYLEIDQSGTSERWIAFEFNVLLHGQHPINWAIIQLPIVSGAVNSTFEAYAQSAFPVDISAASDDNGINTSQNRAKWIELDVTEIIKGAIDNVPDTSPTGDVFIACRCVPVEVGGVARLASSRHTTAAKPKLIIQPAE